MKTIHLPYPVSTNRYWRAFRGRVTPSKEAEQYKAAVRAIAQLAGWKPIDGPVDVVIVLRPFLTAKGTESKVRQDLDNVCKAALDGLNKTAYHDDKQVRRILMTIGEPIKNGGLTLSVGVLHEG